MTFSQNELITLVIFLMLVVYLLLKDVILFGPGFIAAVTLVLCCYFILRVTAFLIR